MRKKLFLAATMALAMTAFAAPALADDAAVTATEGLTQMNDVYQIEDGADLVAFAALVNGGDTDANAILVNDIDLTGYSDYIPMGTINEPYAGDFNGNGNKIKNISITCDDSHIWAGIFGAASGDIYNLTLDNVDVVNNSQSSGGDSAQAASGIAVGALCEGGSVTNVTTLDTCSVEGFYRTGGIVGSIRDEGTVIQGCENNATVTGKANYTGGVVGAAHNNWSLFGGAGSGSSIISCENSGAVTGTSEVGGIVGYTDRASVASCTNTGTVTATGNYGAGGIVGCDIYNPRSILYRPTIGSTIDSCINEGDVSAPRAGGILGSFVVAPAQEQNTRTTTSTIKNCTNTGDISSATGICGAIYGAPISYAHGDGPDDVDNMIVSISNCTVGGTVNNASVPTVNDEAFKSFISPSGCVTLTGNLPLTVEN